MRPEQRSGTLERAFGCVRQRAAAQAATLGVATLAYLPFVFFNLINPVVSMIYGITGFTIERVAGPPLAEGCPDG